MTKNYLLKTWVFICAISLLYSLEGNAQVNTYSFSASSGTYTPLVGGTQVLASITADTELSSSFPIGFDFIYNGITYTSIKASSNGVLFFGAGETATSNNLATSTANQRPGIAPLWDDLQCTEGITYQLNGAAPNQTLTIEWKNMEWQYDSGTPVISFQVILHETTNQIDFVYQQEATAVSSGSASIGLMGTTPTDYISLQGTGTNPTRSTTTSTNSLNTKPATGQVYSWIPPSCIAPNTLTATNITDVSAELGWTQSGGITTWEIEYGTAGFTPTGVANVTGPITNPQVLGGLIQNTSYSFYVRADCGGGDFSTWSGPYTFTTKQTPASIPYTDDFSSNNWILSNGTQTNKWFIGAAAGNPANGLYVSNDNGVTNAYSTGSSSTTHAVKLFAFPSGSNDFDLTFDWKSNGEAGYDYIRVWVIPSSASPTPGTQITTGNITGAVQLGGNLQANSSYTSQSLIIPNSFAGTNAKIVFEWKNDFGGGSQPPGSIDNIDISVITCSAPTALTATNITDVSAELGWTQAGGITTWEVEYGTSGFTPTGVANVTGPITNPHVLGGLTQNTSYSFYVRADCGGGDFSTWSGPYTFTTKQTPVTLPYTDDFSSNKWILGNGSQTNKWFVGSAAGNPANGLYISNDNGVTNAYSRSGSSSIVHATKLISFTAGSNPFELSFDWKNDGESGYDYLRVWIIPASASATPGTGITTGNISGAMQLGGNLSGNTAYTTETFLIPNTYAGTNAKLVFEWKNDGSGGNQPPASIDNISIVELACAAPTALTATSNSGTTAELSWTENGSATVWEVEYGTTGFTPTGTANATGPITNPYTLGGLTAETSYDFYVRSDCGGNFSVWSGPFTFTTSGIPDAPVITQDPTTPTCVAGTDLDLAGSPEPNVYWFWQSSLTGTSTTEPYTGPMTVYFNGTYYANAYDSITGLWSSTTSSFVVSNIPLATAPPAPVAAQDPSCAPLGTTLSVPVPAPGFEYYWQGTTAGGTSTSNDATNPYTATASGTYYVAAYETATSCWSNTVGVTITVDSYIPAAPTAAITQHNICTGETSLPIEANALGSGTETVSSGTINISIPDGNFTGINSSLIMSNIPSGATITDLSVTVNISHIWTEDIDINLTAPNGTTIDLSSDNGYDGDNYTNTVFSSNGVNPITGGTPPFTGTFAAEGNMSSLLSVPNGTWKLNVIDDASIISGTLNNWSISITYSFAVDVEWYDAASNGNLEGTGSPFESIGTSILPSPAASGTYEFYAGAKAGGCYSTSRTLITVNVSDINVELTAVDVSCNGSATGSFEISDTLCGVTPFLVDIDGGGFGPIPTNLVAGTYQVTVQDDNGAISPVYTLIINEAGAPSDAYMEDITDNGGQVSWNANGSETEWNVEWGLPGFTPGTGTEIGSTQAMDTFAIITGLDPNTNYDVYVSANCGMGSTTGDWDMVNWTTDCGIYGLPFIETFEDNSESRPCWYNINEVGTSDWTYETGNGWGVNVNNAFEGSKNAKFVLEPTYGEPITKLASPRFDFAGQDSVAVIFSYSQEEDIEWSDWNETKVYTTGTSGVWTEVMHYTAPTTNWVTDTIFVADTTTQIAFEGINNFGPANTVDYVQVLPCNLNSGTDGSADVCRADGTFDLNSIVTLGETFGKWTFAQNPNAINGSTLDLTALPEGTFNFYYIVQTPCAVDTTTATLTIFPPSSAGVDGTITACRNEPIYLLSGLSGTVDLGGQWYNTANNPIGVNITTSNLPGNYNFDYVVSNGVCPNDTANILVTVGTCDYLDVQELVFGDMNVYPNPTEGLVFITTGSSETFSYELLDVKGQLLSSKEAAINGTKTTEISFENLEPGVYMIRVYNSEAEKTFRIVKQ